jgi:hypothetical protein
MKLSWVAACALLLLACGARTGPQDSSTEAAEPLDAGDASAEADAPLFCGAAAAKVLASAAGSPSSCAPCLDARCCAEATACSALDADLGGSYCTDAALCYLACAFQTVSSEMCSSCMAEAGAPSSAALGAGTRLGVCIMSNCEGEVAGPYVCWYGA